MSIFSSREVSREDVQLGISNNALLKEVRAMDVGTIAVHPPKNLPTVDLIAEGVRSLLGGTPLKKTREAK